MDFSSATDSSVSTPKETTYSAKLTQDSRPSLPPPKDNPDKEEDPLHLKYDAAMEKVLPNLLSLPTELLVLIIEYLPGYDRLCLRIICKRLYSIVSDPRVWECLVWNCSNLRHPKALELALNLCHLHVRNVVISSPATKRRPCPLSTCLPQIDKLTRLRSLTLNNVPRKLDEALSQLPLLKSLTITETITERQNCLLLEILTATASSRQLSHLTLQSSANKVLSCWKKCAYRPPNLAVFDPKPSWEVASQPRKTLQCDLQPALFTIYPTAAANLAHKWPFFEIILQPSFQIVSCSTRSISSSCPPDSCLYLSKGKSDHYTGATYSKAEATLLPCGPVLPSLPDTIVYLCLANMSGLSSDDLTLLSTHAPNLRYLNLDACLKALLVLQGLADISTNCCSLTSLSIKRIAVVESDTLVWEILAQMQRLCHLAVDESLCVTDSITDCQAIRTSVSRINLLSFEVETGEHSYHHKRQNCLQLHLFRPAFRLLQHLLISTTTEYLNLTTLLYHVPKLTGLYISCRTLCLPSNLECVHRIKNFSIKCEASSNISMRDLGASFGREVLRTERYGMTESVQIESRPLVQSYSQWPDTHHLFT